MKNAWVVTFIRFPLLILGLLVMFIFLSISQIEYNFPFLPDLSTIYFTLINIVSFYILYKVIIKEGRSIKELIGFRKETIKKDILYGFLWLMVLYIPFIIAVMATMFLLFGTDFINHFETVFAGNLENFDFARPKWLMWIGALFSLVFPFLNAPIEELMYRGYAQEKFLLGYKKTWLAILIPSIGFSIQHTMLAASIEGALVYAVAFFSWGMVSGFIFSKQKRLMPLIICHFIVNLIFGILPLIFLLSGTY